MAHDTGFLTIGYGKATKGVDRLHNSKFGWKSNLKPPPRKDFALFLRLEVIGSRKQFAEDSNKNGCGIFAEIALTGTALPVLLDIWPSDTFDFGECPVGKHVDALFTIRNESSILPALFQFRRIAHICTQPPNGKIPPGQTQDVIISFAPKQVGIFKPQQLLDVLGQVARDVDPSTMDLNTISSLVMNFTGCSNPITVNPIPRFNPGLTPYISNEVGMYCNISFADLEPDKPRNAVAGSTRTLLHRLRPKSMNLDKKKVQVAFPNDRPRSLRPSDRHQIYRTLFTGMERHHYVDPDYSYLDSVISEHENHLSVYAQHFRSLHDVRYRKLQNVEYQQTNNPIDIGMKPRAGLKPRALKLDELIIEPSSFLAACSEWKPLRVKEMAEAQKEAVSKPVQEGLNAVPITKEEKVDCKKWLSPKELHQVIVGPPIIEFGKVCLRSVSQKELNIVNNLKQYVLVEAEVDCRELRQSSPLSQVVPPRSRAVIPIIFESGTKGNFQRSLMYTVNKFFKNHVTVTAEVVDVGLELSTDILILKPTQGLPAEAGFCGVITLHNRLNYQAEFTWVPIITLQGTAFSIRPASGTVNANSSLDCEVVWHPAYMAPEEGAFQLLVSGGASQKLYCKAELGPTAVTFTNSRIIFGAVPVNLTTTKIALLLNCGVNHAYFQILDPNPFPGLTVTPVHGVVPVGGSAEIRVSLTSESIIKFDTRVQVAIKGGKVIDLRLGGTVESPEVDIDVPNFNFGGVHCGSRSIIPFKLTNKGNTRCKLELNLTRYKDFHFRFLGFQSQEDYNYQMLNPGMTSVTLKPKETLDGELHFIPLDVAAYDFILPVTINHLKPPTPAPTPFSPSPGPSGRNSLPHIINPRPQSVTVITPRKHVIATALRQPLLILPNKIEFSLPASFKQINKLLSFGATSKIELVNNSDRKLKWAFDLRNVSQVMEDGILKFCHSSGAPFISDGTGYGIEGELETGETQTVSVAFCPMESGVYEAVVPVVINEKWGDPYQMLYITGRLQEPSISFDPPSICLTPVPLLTQICCEIKVLASHYTQASELTVNTPAVECEDGDTISPLKVIFQHGNEVPACEGDSVHCLYCKVTFSSPKPVAFTKAVTFTDNQGHSFSLALTATADNSLLTCYAFLAQSQISHTIVRETMEGEMGFAEAMIVPVDSPMNSRAQSRPSTSATSSNFQVSTGSYEHSPNTTEKCLKAHLCSDLPDEKRSKLHKDSESQSSPDLREGAMNKPPTGSDFQTHPHNNFPEAASQLGSAVFPDQYTEEGIFHLEVLRATQRWFSSQGWPGGPFPVTIPDTLRENISHKQAESTKSHGIGKTGNASSKEPRTVYDMINYLSGRSVPGISHNTLLPADPMERVKQIYWQHSTLLTFLRCQGACLASSRPEYLMMPEDFRMWQRLQVQIQDELLSQGHHEEVAAISIHEDMQQEVFEAVSKRAWIDILLQVLKVLVVARVTPRTYKALALASKEKDLPAVSPDPLASNIYSIGERHLLTWLNHYYNKYRTEVWRNCKMGGVPPPRWVVNFELDLMDGLVLGAVLGAYMPFVISTHLENMYSHPTTAEQCLHNALKVVSAMHHSGIDYDLQALDITDPNPVMMLLFVVHLFNILPQYLSRGTVNFVGTLHSTVTRQVKVSNPTSKSLTYQVLLAGQDAEDFNICKGSTLIIGCKQTVPLFVEFTSRYLRPAEATLILVGSRQGYSTGTTLTFSLKTQLDNITPTLKVTVESPCYELQRITLKAENPFQKAGRFRIILVESDIDLQYPQNAAASAKREKSKKIRCKDDIGQLCPDAPPVEVLSRITNIKDLAEEDDPSKLSVFFSPLSSVYLEAKSSTEVEVNFLPFSLREYHCSVIFLNEAIGEFLCFIEAKTLLPLPSPVSCMSSVKGPTEHLCNRDKITVCWKCEVNQSLEEKLLIPVINMAKERALSIAAQQCMSDVELERRYLTGTLMSCTVTAKTMKLLAANPDFTIQQVKENILKSTVYNVECDSANFTLPETLTVPSSIDSHLQGTTANNKIQKGVNMDEAVVELPVVFSAKVPGTYPCKIKLQSKDDVRVYNVECCVSPEGSTALLKFVAPVLESITQEIPIMNMTDRDWKLTATINGDGFSGPPVLVARANSTSKYSLVFQPMLEKEVKGELVLSNPEDKQEHKFLLNGRAEKPLALEDIKLHMEAKKVITHTVRVPNVTKKKLFYRVESDLPFVTGKEKLSVLPRQSVDYVMTLAPRTRGTYSGVITFIAGKNPVIEVDSDGDEMPEDPEAREYDGYRVWYSLEVIVKPPPPERVLPVICECQKMILIEVIVRNPTPQDITLKVAIQGKDLSGPKSISLPAGEKDVYSLIYAPASIGKSKGSLVFFNELVGEFWYELELLARSPAPTTLPPMECELGKWTEQKILLQNPTKEKLVLTPTVSNSNNFLLMHNCGQPIILHPHSSLEVLLHFMPSTLGQTGHVCKIIFSCHQLGELVFIATGTGLLPMPQDPVSVYTGTGTSTTIVIPFRNPMDITVLARVVLKDHSPGASAIPGVDANVQEAFSLLLKHPKDCFRVRPKTTLDIPISFSPMDMRQYKVLCSVIVTKVDGTPWKFVPKDDQGYRVSSMSEGGLQEIRWLFTVYGIPEMQLVKDSQCEVVECQARDREEKSLEVQLAGVVASVGSQNRSDISSHVEITGSSSSSSKLKAPNSVVVGETLHTADEFSYELYCSTEEMLDVLPNSVELKLVKQTRNSAGLVLLLFNIDFHPLRTMNYLAQLHIKGASGGLWKFPLRFVATDPPVDDVINVEASGLGKVSSVTFRLNSQTKNPVIFNAYFEEGSDLELTVMPQMGELLPEEMEGTLFNVNFTPKVYGKIYKGKLIIQTPGMQWSYEVRGVIPEYLPPSGHSQIPMKELPAFRTSHNFVLENMRLVTTAPSSPLKGAPLVHAK